MSAALDMSIFYTIFRSEVFRSIGYIMEDRNEKQVCRNALLAASFSLFIVSPITMASPSDTSHSSAVSIVNVRFAANDEFVFSPRTRQWKAIDANGKVVRTGYGSGGRNYCPDIKRSCHTPTGTFTVRSKGGAGCRSSRYPVGRGGAPMPYCMFFSQYYAVHGSYEVPNWNASHGCIRIQPSDARWLSNNFMHVGTTVVVKPY